MSLLRLGTTGVRRIDLEILRETEKPLRGGLDVRAGRDQSLETTPSQGRSLSCAGAAHRPRDGADNQWAKSPGNRASPWVSNFDQQTQSGQSVGTHWQFIRERR